MSDPNALRKLLLETKGTLFAVLDGAQFEDLPSDLLEGGFVYRSLYRERGDGDRDQLRTIPQMVWLDERSALGGQRDRSEALSALTDLIEDRPAAVFWTTDGGGDELFRHLRGINMVRMERDGPVDQADPTIESDEQFEESAAADKLSPTAGEGMIEPVDGSADVVLFRHADANVMAQVLPALTAEQFARLFGPATMIAFAPDPEWGPSLMHAPRPDGLPPVPSGLLTIDTNTVERIEAARLSASRKRIKGFLSRHVPEHFEGIDEPFLEGVVQGSEASAEELGLRSEAARGRWAYVMMLSDGKAAELPEVRSFLAEGPSPDARMRALMQHTADALRAQR